MASQHIIFAETIAAMKKARKRRAYESDSDSEVDYRGNRGNKLKRKARFAHQGQLASPSGPELYKEIVNHGGYQRAIISRNPPLVDDEGYEVDSDDDEEHILEALKNAAEFNPHANIRLEDILAPLIAVTDLPTHQTLSRPYTSKTLTELTKQACTIMHKENAALWKIKHLQTKLIGDHNWAPCGLMIGPNDIELFDDEYVDRAQAPVKPGSTILELDNAQNTDKPNGYPSPNAGTPMINIHEPLHNPNDTEKADVPMIDALSPNQATTTKDSIAKEERDTKHTSQQEMKHQGRAELINGGADAQLPRNGRAEVSDLSGGDGPAGNGLKSTINPTNPDAQIVQLTNGPVEAAINQTSRRASLESDYADELPIHPMFLPPRSARPDRDLGIPEGEAEDMRRLLQLMVQKQEEVCRGVKRLYEGLLRADRMRKTVLQWSKYEAHVGPNRDMSDGEDWYDKEEWGFDEDLKKGQDEEEDEPQTTKKTRARR